MTTMPQPLAQPNISALSWKQRKLIVLLVDDQPMVGEAVRRMLVSQTDIEFHFCQDPTQAITQALAVRPTVILQDLVMPEMDGMMLVRFFQANEKLHEIPVIVLSTKEEASTKAEAFSLGASDYLVKLPDPIELIARIRHHSNGYIHLLERNEAAAALQAELAEAERYVRTLLPPPRRAHEAQPPPVDWQLITCSTLAGDALGYVNLDPDTLSLYVLDVCGHGVGAALLSVSILNMLRSQTLPGADFRSPQSVLCALNQHFPMEKQNDMYFTIWYGVWHHPSRTLRYASGGHPPALWIPDFRSSVEDIQALQTPAPMIGAMMETQYKEKTIFLPAPGHLYVFSDGVYEVGGKIGPFWTLQDLIRFLHEMPFSSGETRMNRLYQHVQAIEGSPHLPDDFTLVELTL